MAKKKKIEYIRKDKAIEYAQWEGAYKVVTRLEEMKAVNVKPIKSGKWLNEYLDDMNDCWRAECSICKHESHSRFGKVTSNYRYCPNCGAEMEDYDNG